MSEQLASLRDPYGLESALKQATASINEISGIHSLSSIKTMSEQLASPREPYALGSVFQLVKSFSTVIKSNRDLIEQFKNINISEAIQIHNELNNSLKPYDVDDNLSLSNMRWLNIDEVRRIVIEIITLYMFVMFFVNPTLERIDLEKSNVKQQNWFKEELKQQTKELNHLFIPKKKELYYTTIRDNIVFRSNPYIKKSTVKSRLDKGVILLILMRKDNWLNVEFFDEEKEITQVGWVHIKNLKRINVD